MKRARVVGVGVLVAWVAVFAAFLGCTSASSRPGPYKPADEGLVPPIYVAGDAAHDGPVASDSAVTDAGQD